MAFGDLVQQITGIGTSSVSATFASALSFTEPNLVIITAGTRNSTNDFVLTAGNVDGGQISLDNSSGGSMVMYFRVVQASDPLTYTFTSSNSRDVLVLSEYDGGTNGFKAAAEVAGTGDTNLVTTAVSTLAIDNLHTVVSGSLLVGFGASGGGQGTLSVSASLGTATLARGWTEEAELNNGTGGGGVRGIHASAVTSSSGTAGWTLGLSTANECSIISQEFLEDVAGVPTLVWETASETDTPTDWVAAAAGAVTLTWETASETDTPTDWVVALVGPSPSLSSLTSGSDDTPATSFTTVSISPSDDALVLVAVSSEFDTTSPVVPTLSGGGMAAWTQVRTFAWDDSGTTRRMTLFRALEATPGTATLVIDFGAETQVTCRWSVIEFDKVDTGGTNGADAVVQDAQDPAAVGSGTVIDVTLAAFGGGDNVTYGTANKEAPTDGDMTAEAELTVIHNIVDDSNDSRLMVVWKQGEPTDNDVSWSWATGRRRVGFALEIKAAAVAIDLVWETTSETDTSTDWVLAAAGAVALVWETASETDTPTDWIVLVPAVGGTVADDFDRANNGDLNGGAGTGPGHGDWVEGGFQNPPHEIENNQAVALPAGTGHTCYSQWDAGVNTFDNDQIARAIVQTHNTATANWAGVVVRYGAEGDIDTPIGYMARLDGAGDFGIFEFDGAGSADQLAIDVFGASIDTDYEIVIRVEGTTIDIWIEATSTLGTIDVDSDTPTVTTTDASLTAGAIGIASRNSSGATGPHPTFETFEGGDIPLASATLPWEGATETDTSTDWIVAVAGAATLVWETASETDTPDDWSVAVAGAASLAWETTSETDTSVDWVAAAAGAVSLAWETTSETDTAADWIVAPAGSVSLVWEITSESDISIDWILAAAGSVSLIWEGASETDTPDDWVLDPVSVTLTWEVSSETDASTDWSLVVAGAATLVWETTSETDTAADWIVVEVGVGVLVWETTSEADTPLDWSAIVAGSATLVWESSTETDTDSDWSVVAAGSVPLTWETVSEADTPIDWVVAAAGTVTLVWESTSETDTPTDWLLDPVSVTLTWEIVSETDTPADWIITAAGAVSLVWETTSESDAPSDWVIAAAGAVNLVWETSSETDTATDWTVVEVVVGGLIWETTSETDVAIDWTVIGAGAVNLIWEVTSETDTPIDWSVLVAGAANLVWEGSAETDTPTDWTLVVVGSATLTWEITAESDVGVDWTVIGSGDVPLVWETISEVDTPIDWTLVAAGSVSLFWEGESEVDTSTDWIAAAGGSVAVIFETVTEVDVSIDWLLIDTSIVSVVTAVYKGRVVDKSHSGNIQITYKGRRGTT